MEELKNNLHCNKTFKGDKLFKRKARSKQSDFREKVLKVGFDSENRYGQYGAFLLQEHASKGLNFCEEFRTEILERIKLRYPTMSNEQHDGLYANMLRSEHIPWNIFVPLDEDRYAAAKVLNEIIGEPFIDEITRIEIEWAPDKALSLNDNTSFDTYIEYLSSGKKCGIGIEVKYTEEGYNFGKKEYKEVMKNEHSKYAEVTKACGLYSDSVANMPLRETPLCQDKYRQIWRNHILGESMVLNHMLCRFHTVTLFPSGNPHFSEVLPEYSEFLSDYGKSTFRYITFEELFELLGTNYKEAKYQKWIYYLKKRYLF
jgi:hypothetical protein